MNQKSWSRRQVNRQAVRIRTIFKWGVAQGLVSPNTYAALCAVDGLRAGQTDAADHPPIALVTQAQIGAILPSLPKVVVDMIQVQFLTGMRRGELCATEASEMPSRGFCVDVQTFASQVSASWTRTHDRSWTASPGDPPGVPESPPSRRKPV